MTEKLPSSLEPAEPEQVNRIVGETRAAQLVDMLDAPEEILTTRIASWEGVVQHRRYLFLKRSQRANPVLAVVHLDVHGGDNHPAAQWLTQDNVLYLRSRALDDRLGLWMLLELAHRGCDFDLLFTTDEEIGQSSATEFAHDYAGKYSPAWLLEIDRRRIRADTWQPSVVMYQYETPELRKRCEDAGFVVERGTSTDIRFLEEFSVAGFNFSAAYQGEHTNTCTARWDEVEAMLNAIEKFYSQYAGTVINHTN